MKMELRIGGVALLVEAEGAVSVRMLEECGSARPGAGLEWPHSEIAEEAPVAGPVADEELSALLAGLRGKYAPPACVAVSAEAPVAAPSAWDGVFSSQEAEAPAPEETEDEADGGADLFTRLSSLRRQLAAEADVPPYVVFQDKALREMAEKRPQTEAEFYAISGVGKAKLEKYGGAFIAAIKGAA